MLHLPEETIRMLATSQHSWQLTWPQLGLLNAILTQGKGAARDS
jgi:hypothetical protein